MLETTKCPRLLCGCLSLEYCIETVSVTQIMHGDLCGISQLLPSLTIKWDIPADPFIEAHSLRQDSEFIISSHLTAVQSRRLTII